MSPVVTSIYVISTAGSHTSVAVAVPVADGSIGSPHSIHSIVRSPGHEIIGSVVSSIVSI